MAVPLATPLPCTKPETSDMSFERTETSAGGHQTGAMFLGRAAHWRPLFQVTGSRLTAAMLVRDKTPLIACLVWTYRYPVGATGTAARIDKVMTYKWVTYKGVT